MKIWVITKKRGIALLALFVLLVTGLSVARNSAVAVSGNVRDLPIYCVDRGDEKIASISFDAACPNGRVANYFHPTAFSS